MIDVINPATEEVFTQIPRGTAEDVDRAVASAECALTGAWRGTTGSERAALLRAIGEKIGAEKQALAELEVRDNGKPLPEALSIDCGIYQV
jgi:betaine-aldehyde dehydrogenase